MASSTKTAGLSRPGRSPTTPATSLGAATSLRTTRIFFTHNGDFIFNMLVIVVSTPFRTPIAARFGTVVPTHGSGSSTTLRRTPQQPRRHGRGKPPPHTHTATTPSRNSIVVSTPARSVCSMPTRRGRRVVGRVPRRQGCVFVFDVEVLGSPTTWRPLVFSLSPADDMLTSALMPGASAARAMEVSPQRSGCLRSSSLCRRQSRRLRRGLRLLHLRHQACRQAPHRRRRVKCAERARVHHGRRDTPHARSKDKLIELLLFCPCTERAKRQKPFAAEDCVARNRPRVDHLHKLRLFDRACPPATITTTVRSAHRSASPPTTCRHPLPTSEASFCRTAPRHSVKPPPS